ncbi:MAG: primosomal protein N' [Planctomycetes bacterium]|nr:primosomal protein N' [Planctomycetota bacterium]
MSAPVYLDVALNLPLRREFTYALPAGLRAEVGNRVLVPFRGRRMPGVVTAVGVACTLAPGKVRPIERIVDAGTVLPPALLVLARRIAEEYGCSLGEALDATLPAAAKARGERRIPHLELAVTFAEAERSWLDLEEKAQERSRVLRAVAEFGAPMPVLDVRRRTGTSDSPWQTLVKHGLLRRVLVAQRGEDLALGTGETVVRHELNAEQLAAADAVRAAVAARRHEVFLLHGVTGSGKTEVYLHVLEAVRAQGRGAIVLVPEISLTPQTVGRFRARFPDVAVLHSGLTEAQRGQQWRQILSGRAQVVVGARSALFAPLRDLGLIVVDEEHEGTFKQENTPRYHAREMAVARGEIESAPVILGSATPSLESYGRARRGAYRLLELRQRAGAGQLPRIVIEDLRVAEKPDWVNGVPISRTLRRLMEERMRARDQVILFLNRRGFAPVLICGKCGSTLRCERCAVTMTYHLRRGRLVCHYCCAERRRPEMCPTCSHPRLHELGTGTERVTEAVKGLFPDRIVVRMDADTTAARGSHEQILTAFRKKQIDILVGTQMLAKGHDFPDVTLVGVISADTGLFVPDYRAAERTFQLLSQVAGRAGRGDKPGIVVFQTLNPDNYAIQAAARLDYDAFVRTELGFRRDTGYPPYSRLVRVLFEGLALPTVQAQSAEVAGTLRDLPGVVPLGPAPAIQERLKDRHRMHVLVKCATREAFLAAMARLATVEDRTTQTLRVTLDVDPGSLL